MSCDRMLSCCSDAGRVNSLPIKSHVARHSPKSNIVCIDGVYAADDDDRPQFQVLPAPDDAEIVRLTETLAARIRAFLRQRGLGPDSDPEESDPLSRDEPWLAYLYMPRRCVARSSPAPIDVRLGTQIRSTWKAWKGFRVHAVPPSMDLACMRI